MNENITHFFFIQGNKFVMYIILPDSIDGLHDLVSKINPTLLGESIKNMKSFSTKLVLPRFNYEYTSILGPILQKVGRFFSFKTLIIYIYMILYCIGV